MATAWDCEQKESALISVLEYGGGIMEVSSSCISRSRRELLFSD